MIINIEKIQIDKAIESDFDMLTQISFAAKKQWNYYFDAWRVDTGGDSR
jgi:hypothetical protein